MPTKLRWGRLGRVHRGRIKNQIATQTVNVVLETERLAHHVWMYLLFGPAQQLAVFLLPMLLQGLAVGFVMIPLALFTMGGLPPQLASAGTFAAVTFRNLGFAGSLAVTSVLQPYWRTAQLDRFRADLLPGTSEVATRVRGLQQTLQGRGLDLETAQHGAASLLARTLETQTLLR